MANINQASNTNGKSNRLGCATIGIVTVGVIALAVILFLALGGSNLLKPPPPTATSPHLRLGVAAQQVNVTDKLSQRNPNAPHPTP